jgi:uncharacterized protein (DUF2236 family)
MTEPVGNLHIPENDDDFDDEQNWAQLLESNARKFEEKRKRYEQYWTLHVQSYNEDLKMKEKLFALKERQVKAFEQIAAALIYAPEGPGAAEAKNDYDENYILLKK